MKANATSNLEEACTKFEAAMRNLYLHEQRGFKRFFNGTGAAPSLKSVAAGADRNQSSLDSSE
jgi:hypothetical protein